MKRKRNSKAADSTRAVDGEQAPTIFERVMDLQVGLCKSAGLPVDHLPAPSTVEMPKWFSKIFKRFCKTILKPVLALRPNGTMNWRNYGRMIGVIERCKTFITHDVARLLEEAGFGQNH